METKMTIWPSTSMAFPTIHRLFMCACVCLWVYVLFLHLISRSFALNFRIVNFFFFEVRLCANKERLVFKCSIFPVRFRAVESGVCVSVCNSQKRRQRGTESMSSRRSQRAHALTLSHSRTSARAQRHFCWSRVSIALHSHRGNGVRRRNRSPFIFRLLLYVCSVVARTESQHRFASVRVVSAFD